MKKAALTREAVCGKHLIVHDIEANSHGTIEMVAALHKLPVKFNVIRKMLT
jgi:hypothetical protein